MSEPTSIVGWPRRTVTSGTSEKTRAKLCCGLDGPIPSGTSGKTRAKTCLFLCFIGSTSKYQINFDWGGWGGISLKEKSPSLFGKSESSSRELSAVIFRVFPSGWENFSRFALRYQFQITTSVGLLKFREMCSGFGTLRRLVVSWVSIYCGKYYNSRFLRGFWTNHRMSAKPASRFTGLSTVIAT